MAKTSKLGNKYSYSNEAFFTENHYRSTLDSMVDAIHVVDTDLRIVFINRHFLQWLEKLGINADIIGKKLPEVFPFLPKRVLKECEHVLKSGEILITEENTEIDNQDIYTETRKIPVFNGKRVIQIITIVRNITDRKQAETALKESETRFRGAFETSGIGMALVAPDGRWLKVNTALCKMVGYSEAELMKKTFQDITYFDDLTEDLEYVNQMLKGEIQSYHMEKRYIHKDGHIIWILLSVSLVRDENGEPKHFVSQIQDITDRKKHEEQLRNDKKGLEKAVDEKDSELTCARKQLDDTRRLSDIGMLAATVAHELRNPLGVMKLAVYNMRRKRKEPVLDSHLKNIEKKITESDQIIKNLLIYSRLQMPHYEHIPLYCVIADCIAALKEKYQQCAIEITLTGTCRETDLMEGDLVHMTELFSNIIDNAFQAFPDKEGTIRVICTRDEKNRKLIISVQDNGIGIEKNDLPRIFEPFFTRKSRGIGLGMSVCRQIVHLHNGDIAVDSKLGKGTTISVTLPLDKKE